MSSKVIVLDVLCYLCTLKMGDGAIQAYSTSSAAYSDTAFNRKTINNMQILGASKLSIPNINETLEIKPDTSGEWIIDLRLNNHGKFKREDLWNLFDYEWRTNFRSQVYGYINETKSWTYVIAGGSPEFYDKVQLGVKLLDVYELTEVDFDAGKLEKYITELEKRFKKHQLNINAEPNEPASAVIERVTKLVSLKNEFDRDVIIVLAGEMPFDGVNAWNALINVGVTWGDGDLFHWKNETNFGSEHHFSVWTSTEPGYFLPQVIESGDMNPETLVFGFPILISDDPENIFEAMLNAAKYCQKVLGGRLQNSEGQPFNETEERTRIKELVGKMKSHGILPGSQKAAKLY